MSASPTDYFKKVTNNFATNTNTLIVNGTDTSVGLNSVTNLATDTGIVLVIDRVDSNGNLTPAKVEYIAGVVSGTNIVSLRRGLGGSTAATHASGAVVEQVTDQILINEIITGLLVSHNQDGTIKAGAITTSNLGSGTVQTANIAASAVVTASVADGSITDAKLFNQPVSIASASTITPSSTDYIVTAQAAAATIAAPSIASPTNKTKFLIRIKDNGSAQTLAWNAAYRAVGVTLPTTTVAGKLLYVGGKYNADAATWDVLGIGRE